MIVISTNHNPTSRILEEIATELVLAAGNQVTRYLDSRTPSNATNIHYALNPNDKKAFCFFGHGQLSPPVGSV